MGIKTKIKKPMPDDYITLLCVKDTDLYKQACMMNRFD